MRYDGVETKFLLRKNSSKMSLLLLCSLAFEIIGYTLYKKSTYGYQWAFYFCCFFFFAVMFCFILIYKTLLFPGKLKLVYGRGDVTERDCCSIVDLLRHGAVALSVVLYDIICILRIINGNSI
ncbi:hypothetical protein EC841_101890 [Raoultella ornithinolytica]|jgi:hypothetical protein|uniref:MARVEL domain-containing protein n=1 Tax=Raoultella ornithinolytica TaxID=54291 RepID=A0ABD7QR58_RAOOR|nr:hypothetical protein EC841_101890 [Raoultella ornithinolytica]